MVSKSNETLSWHDARQECASLAGNYDLAIVNTSEIFEFLKEYDSHWIGLIHREGNVDGFQWVDGKGLDFGGQLKGRPWSDTEPNDFLSEQSCVHNMAAGLWADTHCGAKYNYICGPERGKNGVSTSVNMNAKMNSFTLNALKYVHHLTRMVLFQQRLHQ